MHITQGVSMTNHMSPAAEALNERQRMFCHEMLVDWNQTAAYIRVYNPESHEGAEKSASRLMKLSEVQAYIAELVNKRNARTDVTADRVVLELARIGFSDIRRMMAWGETFVVPSDDPDEPEQIDQAPGVRWFPSEALEDDIAAAIAEVKETITQSENDDGRLRITRTKSMKLHPKMTALNKLAEHTGVGRDGGTDAGMTVNVTVNGMTPEQQSNELTELFEDIDQWREENEPEEEIGEEAELEDRAPVD